MSLEQDMNLAPEFQQADSIDAQTESEGLPYIVVAPGVEGDRDIHAVDLTVALPNGRVLVENVNLVIKEGQRVIFTGASGTGKTTVAKALLNQWDDGNGTIIMPKGVRMMVVSQHAYFPNTTLRGIMNMSPDHQPVFKDEELVSALRTVGHDRLIQHIPGQQVQILIDGLMEPLGEIIDGYKGQQWSDTIADEIRHKIESLINQGAQEQFDVVQYVPDAQKRDLYKRVTAMLEQSLDMSGADDVAPISGFSKLFLSLVNPAKYKAQTTSSLSRFMDGLTDDIDIALTKPLREHLGKLISNVSEARGGFIVPYSKSKAGYFSWWLERKLKVQMDRYLHNKDTDDVDRDIRMNEAQSEYIQGVITKGFDEHMRAAVPQSKLGRVFNALTWPLSAIGVLGNAKAAARETAESIGFFMDKQILTGDNLTLSGGERQKLMIAMVLLHRPDVLILDEITAALDQETAQSLYREMMDKIPEKTTVLSIAHNTHIMQFHTHHAHLENQGITLTPLKPSM